MVYAAGGARRSTTESGGPVVDRSGDDVRGLAALEDELRAVHARIDRAREQMRLAIDVFGLVSFGLALVGLIVVSSLAGVSFVSGDTGVALLFSALTLIALPIVGIAAWHAFNRMWALSRELSGLHGREATIFARLETVRAPVPISEPAVHASGVSGLMGGLGRPARRVEVRLPPGRTADGFREVTHRNRLAFGRSSSLWLLAGVGVLFLIFVIGVALGSATTH